MISECCKHESRVLVSSKKYFSHYQQYTSTLKLISQYMWKAPVGSEQLFCNKNFIIYKKLKKMQPTLEIPYIITSTDIGRLSVFTSI